MFEIVQKVVNFLHKEMPKWVGKIPKSMLRTPTHPTIRSQDFLLTPLLEPGISPSG